MPMKYWRRLVRNKKLLLTSAAVLLGIGVLLGCQENTAIADLTKPEAAPVKDKTAGDVKKYSSQADVPRISVEDAKKAFDEGAVFVDSRPESAYKVEHIAGAINIPSGAGAEEKFSSLPKGKKIIVYCS
jgi:hypothetical protein